MTGVWNLIKLILRRDRVKLPVWILSLTGILVCMIPILRDTYATPETLSTLHQQFSAVPAGLFLTGPMDGANFGSLFTLETILWWGIMIAFMNTLFVIRHTRQNEEMGAQELIFSGRVHRSANLVAVLIVALSTNIVMATIMGLGMDSLYDAWGNGSVALYAVTMGVFGFVWASIAAILTQLFESTRTANTMAAILIGVAFMLRGIGDFLGEIGANGTIQAAWPSWLSPFGWSQATRSLTFPDWLPLLAPLVFVVVAIPLAFFMLSRRDVGSGLLPARSGHARASKFLRTPLGLTWYLQKNVFLGWACGAIALVAVVGALVPQMSKVYDSSPDLAQMIAAMGGNGALIPTFLSAMLMIAVLMILAYAIHALSRTRVEESSEHLESLLGTHFSRTKWLGLHLAVVLIGAAVMLVVSGLIMALCVNTLSSWSVDVGEYVIGALSYWPLVALLAGLYIALFGLLPRATGAVLWAVYGFIAFMSWIGPLMRLDQWIMDLSPLSHMASAPAEAIRLTPLAVLSVIALMLGVLGFMTWRNRNLVQH
ncbi:hypothetical protein FWF93_00165 [Candidatus Saccharibacteria bacterium]|nr:hypothetical protein [Candidatus Saccharibacteria bacterium]